MYVELIICANLCMLRDDIIMRDSSTVCSRVDDHWGYSTVMTDAAAADTPDKDVRPDIMRWFDKLGNHPPLRRVVTGGVSIKLVTTPGPWPVPLISHRAIPPPVSLLIHRAPSKMKHRKAEIIPSKMEYLIHNRHMRDFHLRWSIFWKGPAYAVPSQKVFSLPKDGVSFGKHCIHNKHMRDFHPR